MMIEIIAMYYGNVCAGMKALTFNENALMLAEVATAQPTQRRRKHVVNTS